MRNLKSLYFQATSIPQTGPRTIAIKQIQALPEKRVGAPLPGTRPQRVGQRKRIQGGGISSDAAQQRVNGCVAVGMLKSCQRPQYALNAEQGVI